MEGDRVDILLLAAHQLELVSPGAGEREQFGALRVAADSVGVGIAAAGGGAARLLVQLRPRSVVLLGSCGVYPGLAEPELLGLLVPDRIVLLDSATLDGAAGFPEPMARDLETSVSLSSGLRGAAQTGTLATTMTVTSDDDLALRLAASGCTSENLEAFSVGLACKEAGIPFAAVMGVTNIVGAEGRKHWRQNHSAAARLVCAHVRSWLDAGAAGSR